MATEIKENSQILAFELDLSNEMLALEELKILIGKPILVNNGHALIEIKRANKGSKNGWNLQPLILNCLKRLAFSRAGYLYLFSCKNSKESILKISKFDWNNIFEKDFSFRKKEGFCKSLKELSEREIGGAIWDAMEIQCIKPKVTLLNAKTSIEAIEFNKRIIFLKRIWQREKLELRKPVKRAGFHPSGIHPKIARACINISKKISGKLLDPFCGSGGIIIESALMGYDSFAIDVDVEMIKKCKKNLLELDLCANIKLGDAFRVEGKYDLVVTDPPYGKNSQIKSDESNTNNNKKDKIDSFYIEFLKIIKKNTSNLVMIFPSFANWKRIVKEAGWSCDFSTEIYVHKSLSRIITRLKR